MTPADLARASQDGRIHIVQSVNGDWQGLYVFDDLILEGHSLDVRDVFKALGINCEFEEVQIPISASLPARYENLP
jgi:hypothetical protein